MKSTSTEKNYGNTWETEVSDSGEFVRHQTEFRARISSYGSAEFPSESERYHLYVSYACPWAHRTLIARKLKGLEKVISYDVVHPFLPRSGWSFDSSSQGATGDRVNGFENLKQAYLTASPQFDGAVTVPVLWDKKTKKIVNNESSEILRLLNFEFQQYATNPDLDLYPQNKRAEIDELNDWIYRHINNGVYRCGFATSQTAYSKAFEKLFAALDRVESILGGSRYLTGPDLTEADIRLFTTLVRFDAVYVTHFKCNRNRIVDFPNISGFTRDLYQTPGVAETVNMTHIKHHYYESHLHINPFGIVPDGPELDFEIPHGRS
ncbi:glutathione-dependent reductase [Sulfitobacter sp. SK012]|uniref:glutathione S-transferase family protein n=1 Tax=Sulfitobacter sp. SK012 TaxID=1389005 RepID=UPI000E0A6CEB|nr:glutathione S-transferase family protein [Sulfitobacter sp. SK012]AXI47899.1 glutathione-dependent reductase [Sulfitobacter sp. SK012]